MKFRVTDQAGHEIKLSASIQSVRASCSLPRANESAAVGHHLVTYRFESGASRARRKRFFSSSSSARREGRVGPKNLSQAQLARAQDQRIPAAAMLCTYNCSCTVDHNAAVGNDPVTCGFESGASHAGGKKVLFVVVERASRRREGRVGPKNLVQPNCSKSRSQDQRIPAAAMFATYHSAALWSTAQLWETIL